MIQLIFSEFKEIYEMNVQKDHSDNGMSTNLGPKLNLAIKLKVNNRVSGLDSSP